MREVRFTIDDVNVSFRECVEKEYRTIFEHPLFNCLLSWKHKFNLKVTLFLVLENQGFSITEIPEKYIADFKKSKEWLRFSFHSRNFSPAIDDDDFEQSLSSTIKTIRELQMGLSDVVRLHNWEGNETQKRILKNAGISELLYKARDDRYNENGIFYDMGLKHIRTDRRIEQMDEINSVSCLIGQNHIEIFTHEWCFLDQVGKIERILNVYMNESYSFV